MDQRIDDLDDEINVGGIVKLTLTPEDTDTLGRLVMTVDTELGLVHIEKNPPVSDDLPPEFPEVDGSNYSQS
jgi:hypothetical protein